MPTYGGNTLHFADRLVSAVRHVGNPVLVGIDPRLEDLPGDFLERFPATKVGVAEALRIFSCGIVDAIQGLVPAVKYQAAFYELHGAEGMAALAASTRYARDRGLIVVMDGKRNDIGSTALAYAMAYLGPESEGTSQEAGWASDALTVNPYLGSDGILPFVEVAERGGKGLFVLVRTSNPSAGDLQDLVSEGRPIYRHVAERLAGWASGHRGVCGFSHVGAVVGATYPEQLAELREALPGILFLVPGYGAQGGSASDVAAAFDADGLGAVVNSSRGLTFAYKRPAFARFGGDWQGAVQAAVREMADDLGENTPASKLRRHGQE